MASCKTGVFPDKMKIAKVVPIYKSGDMHVVSNYRAIALLSQFSKILEKLFVNRLDGFIEKYSLLSDHQYGFRSQHSTSLVVMDFVENIATAVDNKQYGIGVFTDLHKVFDTIDHSLLLEKLGGYGIRGVTQQWLRSYLDNRFQYVKFNNTESQLKKVTHGVPQGSVLGPKLFILCLNDIFTVSNTMKCVAFADDTNLYCTGDDLNELRLMVESELNVFKKWFDRNKLSLNENKTKFMVFGRGVTDCEIKLNLNGKEIERVHEFKFLGVVIDHKLSWKPHIEFIRCKLAKSIGIIYKLRDLLNEKCLQLLHSSLVVPYMIYCVEVWGNVYKANLDPIIKLQKRAIRIINKADYRETTNPLFIKSHSLKFVDMVYSKTVEIVFRVKNKSLPNCILNRFVLRENNYNLRGLCVYKISKARTCVKTRCVSVLGVKLWNSFTEDLKRCGSLQSFKKSSEM